MTPSWSAAILTIFPEMFPGPLGMALSGKALDDGLCHWMRSICATLPMTATRVSTIVPLAVVPVW